VGESSGHLQGAGLSDFRPLDGRAIDPFIITEREEGETIYIINWGKGWRGIEDGGMREREKKRENAEVEAITLSRCAKERECKLQALQGVTLQNEKGGCWRGRMGQE